MLKHMVREGRGSVTFATYQLLVKKKQQQTNPNPMIHISKHEKCPQLVNVGKQCNIKVIFLLLHHLLCWFEIFQN